MVAVTRLGPGGTPIAAVADAAITAHTATFSATEGADTFAGAIELTAPPLVIAIDDIVLPGITLEGSECGLISDSAIVTTAFGIETRRANLPVLRENFTLSYFGATVATVCEIFRTQDGQVRALLIDDIDDNEADDVELLKVTVVGVTRCQLRQVYQSLSVYTSAVVRSAYMPVYKIKIGTLTVTVDDVPASSPGDYTEADGVITFTTLVSGDVKASFGFYKIVRFAEDKVEAVFVDDDIRDLRACKLISLVVPSSIAFGLS